MTIRRNIDLKTMSDTFRRFEEACDNASGDLLGRAKRIRDFPGTQADNFLIAADLKGIGVCNCDGIREIESLMFDMVRRKATDNDADQIESAIIFGEALADRNWDDQESLIAYVDSNANTLKTVENWKTAVRQQWIEEVERDQYEEADDSDERFGLEPIFGNTDY